MKLQKILIGSWMFVFAVVALAGCGKENRSNNEPNSISYVDEDGDTVQFEWEAGMFSDSRDGHRYKTVTVEGYTWMAENLTYGVEDEASVNPYGKFYAYTEALNACPAGWHLPSLTDWLALFDALKKAHGDSVGWALKSTSGWDSTSDGVSGNGGDVIGFSAEAGGISNNLGEGEGRSVAYWVNMDKNEEGSVSAIRFDYDNKYWTSPNYYTGRSQLYVRCINDANTMLGTLGTCSESREGSVAKYNDGYFTCKDSSWIKSSKEEILDLELGACEASSLGSLKILRDTSYTCDSYDSTWRVSTMNEVLGVCSDENDGTLKPYLKGMYICDFSSYSQWRKARANEVLPKCTAENNTDFDEYIDTAYVCLDGQWQIPSDIEKVLQTCSESLKGTTKNVGDTAQYICLNRFWRMLNIVEKQLGVCAENGATGVFDGIPFTCDAKRFLWRGNLNDKYGVVAVDSVLWLTEDVYNGQWSASPFRGTSYMTICPADWGITSDTAWQNLFAYADQNGGWKELVHVDSDSTPNFYGLNLLQDREDSRYWLSSATSTICSMDDICQAPAASITHGSRPSISFCWACNTYATAGVCTANAGIRCVKSVK